MLTSRSIRERVIGTIKGVNGNGFRDLERFKRLSRRLKLALLSLWVVTLCLVGASWFAFTQRSEHFHKNLFAQQLEFIQILSDSYLKEIKGSNDVVRFEGDL